MTRHTPYKQHDIYRPGRLSALLPLSVFVWLLFQMPKIRDGGQRVIQIDWVPELGVRLSFVLDGLSLLFALIISGIGVIVVLYSEGYMDAHHSLGRYYACLHAFLLSMLGLVLSNHLLVMFVFWELTTLFSFLLIGFEHESRSARSSARQAMLVTGGGGLALLVGIVLIEQVTGTYSLSGLAEYDGHLREHSLYLPILACVLAGAFTKSAQFPFHFWLPNAMSAPTPISAFLHSATMVKAGVFLLARMHPVLGGTAAWMTTLVVVGAATAVWGAVVSLAQSDMKRILAYTTVAALGIITMFLGGSTTPALTAAITFLLVHALYKSSLFMVAGAIDHQTGTRDIRAIGGIGKTMPFTAAAALLAALSMAGFPLFLGFIGKEIMYKGALTEDVYPGLATGAALLSNALMAAIAATLTLRPFWGGQGRATPEAEAPWQMWLGPLALGLVSIGFGMIPDTVGRWLVEPAVLAFHSTTEDIKLKLFYGFNEPLLLSMLTLLLGGVTYAGRRRVRGVLKKLTGSVPFSMESVYDGLDKATIAIARWQTRILQSGSLFQYLVVIIGSWVLMVGYALLSSADLRLNPFLFPESAWLALLILSMAVGIGVVVVTRSRLLAICALGVIGAGMSMIFFAFGAPDVGLTQLLVETLTLIIAAIVLLRLPRVGPTRRHNGARRVLRLVAALSGGALVTALLMSVNHFELDRSVSDFYEKASYLEAHGRNIVNVILVDFRSLDTLGEIIVVAASALGILALIQRERKAP